MRWRVEYAGVPLTITAESDAAEPWVAVALADMPATEAAEANGARLTVAGEEGAWRLTDQTNRRTRSPKTPGDLIYHLTDRIVHHVAATANRHHCLHAAAVTHDGRALILPAGSGSGKSLLTAWLVASGFEYITDELILVNEDYGVGGIARPIQIKSGGLPFVRPLVGAEDRIIPGHRSSSVPVARLRGRASGSTKHKLGLVIFPEFRPNAGFALSRLTASEAGMRFISGHINARNLRGHGFPSLMEMVRDSDCYVLEYGGFHELPDGFAEHLRNLLKTAPSAVSD